MHRRFRIRTGNRGTRGMNARRSHGYLRGQPRSHTPVPASLPSPLLVGVCLSPLLHFVVGPSLKLLELFSQLDARPMWSVRVSLEDFGKDV